MRKLFLFFALAASSYAAAQPSWLDLVAPVITGAEKKAYLALKPEERAKFEQEFWSGKNITASDYMERIAYVDAKFGSTKPGSGANTDQGRVYLALGAPDRITRIPSSRIFFPIEIWYYAAVRGVINTEVKVMFFQKNGTGLLKQYSPTLDTIRALLIPQSSTVNMFGPNDDLKVEDIRNQLQVSPVEDEVLTASVEIASGIRYEGNEDIIGKISSPQYMLRLPLKPEVTSRLILSHAKLETVESVSPYGGAQVDLKLETPAQKEIDLEVSQGDVVVYQNKLRLRFDDSEPVLYTHRLDLLPGSYRVIVTVDGIPAPNSIEVPKEAQLGPIQRASAGADVAAGRTTPFEFEGRQFELSATGGYAILPLPHPGKITWMIRHGGQVLWRGTSEGQQIASVQLPVGTIEPGAYRIEALYGETSTSAPIEFGKEDAKPSRAPVVSFNANLAPARRLAFIGHQWLLRGNLDEARRALEASLAKGITTEARIELARADALGGNLDAGRDEVKIVLTAEPNNFEALSVFAYIETKFQDYAVAADLYRRALRVQDSPAVRAALAKLPAQ